MPWCPQPSPLPGPICPPPLPVQQEMGRWEWAASPAPGLATPLRISLAQPFFEGKRSVAATFYGVLWGATLRGHFGARAPHDAARLSCPRPVSEAPLSHCSVAGDSDFPSQPQETPA